MEIEGAPYDVIMVRKAAAKTSQANAGHTAICVKKKGSEEEATMVRNEKRNDESVRKNGKENGKFLPCSPVAVHCLNVICGGIYKQQNLSNKLNQKS